MPAEPDTERKFTEAMGEISGMGGGYEAGCQAMVLAGMAWLDAHPDADPHFKGFKGVFGVLADDNDDAKALTAAITSGTDDCTGAMHHASVNHCMAYKRLGWDEYVRQLEEREKREASE